MLGRCLHAKGLLHELLSATSVTLRQVLAQGLGPKKVRILGNRTLFIALSYLLIE